MLSKCENLKQRKNKTTKDVKMKLMFISDIHGSYADLQQVFDVFQKEKADKLIILGDYLNHGPRNPLPQSYDTKKCAELLNSNKTSIIGIKGNCDSEVDQMMLDFSVLEPTSRIFLFDNSSDSPSEVCLFLHHGHQFTEEKLISILPKNSVVLSGHTHIPVLYEKENLIFVNPGSISIPKSEEGKCYGIIEVQESKKSIEIKGLFDSEQKKCLIF